MKKFIAILAILAFLPMTVWAGPKVSRNGGGQPLDTELTAIAGLTSAANAIPYFTGSGTAGLIASSANMVSLLESADYAAARTNLGLAIGTNVQAYDAELAAIAGLTSAAGSIPYFTGTGTATTLTAGSANYMLGMNSGGTAPEWKSSLPISSLDLSSSTSSVPWVVATTTPATFNANGMAWYDSDGYALIIRDQTNTRNLTFVPEGIATGGLIFGDASPDAAGEIGYDGALKYYNTASRTVVSLDETQTLTNKTLTAPVITAPEVFIDCSGEAAPYAYCTSANASTLAAAQVSRTIINTYGRGEAQTVTLPTAAAGMTFIVIVGTQHNSKFEIAKGASDLYLEVSGAPHGVAAFSETNEAVGSRASCATFKTGEAAWSWMCGGISGTWDHTDL